MSGKRFKNFQETAKRRKFFKICLKFRLKFLKTSQFLQIFRTLFIRKNVNVYTSFRIFSRLFTISVKVLRTFLKSLRDFQVL